MTLATGKNRRARGVAFTLIELILVMVLLVVVVSLIAPNLSGFVRGRSLGSEAGRMIALMHAAQSRAASEGMPVMFWVDAANRSYGTAEETPMSPAGDSKAEAFTADDNLQISVVNSGGTATPYKNMPAIRFQADGTVDENSPRQLRIVSADGGSLWLVQMKNRMGYEVRETSN